MSAASVRRALRGALQRAVLRGAGRARHGLWVIALLGALALGTLAPAPVLAQSGSAAGQTTGATASEPSAADRQAAGQAYDRATAAYLARDYPRAATLFETAYRLAPASAALLQAVRAHERAGNNLRAATLALRLQAFYASDAAASRQAETTLAATRAQFARIDVTCAGTCTLELDGVLQDHSSFFAAPGIEHTVRATFETGPVEHSVTGAAGATERVAFEAPAAPIADAHDEQTGPDTADDRGGSGLSPIPFVIALVATAGAGGVLVWSGVDALDGVPAYEAMPTAERLADGQSRELRTNILIGVTGALALTALVLAIVTDWDGDGGTAESESPQVSLTVTPDLGVLTLGGSF